MAKDTRKTMTIDAGGPVRDNQNLVHVGRAVLVVFEDYLRLRRWPISPTAAAQKRVVNAKGLGRINRPSRRTRSSNSFCTKSVKAAILACDENHTQIRLPLPDTIPQCKILLARPCEFEENRGAIVVSRTLTLCFGLKGLPSSLDSQICSKRMGHLLWAKPGIKLLRCDKPAPSH